MHKFLSWQDTLSCQFTRYSEQKPFLPLWFLLSCYSLTAGILLTQFLKSFDGNSSVTACYAIHSLWFLGILAGKYKCWVRFWGSKQSQWLRQKYVCLPWNYSGSSGRSQPAHSCPITEPICTHVNDISKVRFGPPSAVCPTFIWKLGKESQEN